MYKIYPPSRSILKAYLNQSVSYSEIFQFKNELQKLLSRINENESEEFNKNLVIDFFNKSLYKEHNYMVNTYRRTDLAIYSGAESQAKYPMVLFEFKGPGRPDMVSKDDLKQKSLYELILYYIREEAKNKNTGIKHLVITNCKEYFIFSKKLFYELFVKNKNFVRKVLENDTSENTDYIYNAIIKPEVEHVEDKIEFTYLNLADFSKRLDNDDLIKEKKFIAAYKLFSPIHLLKLPFKSDHNTLNKEFYNELLYIMGVEEVVDDGVHKINQLKRNKQSYSLVEQTFSKLDDYSDFKDDKERFDTALGLVLTWINRILFLKLLESQIQNFTNMGSSKFLDSLHIDDYDALHDLFMKVLAKPYNERSQEMKQQFSDVPYLNSSLFELTLLERTYFPISGIRLGNIDVYSRTVLKNERGRRLSGSINTLQYLLQFLDAYDFGGDKYDLVRNDSKSLINASVLGLIFEKINGYKDGSFFTPSFITEYICRKTIRQAVVDKFNDLKGWNCSDFDDLSEHIDYRTRENRTEANEIINSLKICDPAVGSGHFLVSALNEIISIKSELGILQDRTDKPKRIMDYEIRVEDDELVVFDEDGDNFYYNPSEPVSQRIQETLFEEKKHIIENCLFGVDLNPKSVEICRLRLWIELLKNAYYKYNDQTGRKDLQTLPNIDINIKCGNSLASNYPVCLGAKLKLTSKEYSLISDYKHAVKEYKETSLKEWKTALKTRVSGLKRKLQPDTQYSLFDENSQDFKENVTLKHALEWMIEFPEVLDDKGKFLGFDVMIGNPPYISLEKLRTDSAVYNKMKRKNEDGVEENTYLTHQSRGDLYSLFIERGYHLLRKGGLLTYIVPNKWEKVMYGQPLRTFFLEENLYQLIDFDDAQLFEDAITYTCIIQMKKQKQKETLISYTHKLINPTTLEEDVEKGHEAFVTKDMNDGIWYISSLTSFTSIGKYKSEMSTLEKYVGGEAYYGIKTGLTAAFNISNEVAEDLIAKDVRSKDILRPFLQGRGLVSYQPAQSNSFLIFIPKGFTISKMGLDKETDELPDEQDAWNWFAENYIAIAKWLEPFRVKARKRADKGDYWWELRACAYYDKFDLPKLFYQAFQIKPCFVYDESATFCNNSMFFLSVEDKSLLALLCSRVGWWLISEFCPRIQGGYQLIWDNFKQIPIPHELPKVLDEYAEKVMENISNEEVVEAYRALIDQEIYKLYGLTGEEPFLNV